MLPAFGRPDALTVDVHFFHQHITNLIVFTTLPDGTSTEENVDRADIHGIEAGFRFTPAPWFSARLDYTHTSTQNLKSGAALLRRPENAGSVTLTLRPVKGLSIKPSIRHIGRFSDYLYANSGYPSGISLARPGTIVNLAMNYRINRALTLFVVGRNLTNSSFEPVNGTQIPGQNVLFGLRGTLGG